MSAIFVILSSIVLANNSRFGNLIILQNLAHDIALSIREAQVYGIAVQRYSTNRFDVAYGMHFTRGASVYELFADANANGVFDSGETVKSTTIAAGYTISDLCVLTPGSSSDVCSLTEVNVIFKRPEPDALIRRSTSDTLNQRATIVVQSNRGDQLNIVVEATGQISVP